MACAQIEVQNTSSSSTASATRPPRFTMEGVGARVIRGPDWKWGKQVSSKIRTFATIEEYATSLSISHYGSNTIRSRLL